MCTPELCQPHTELHEGQWICTEHGTVFGVHYEHEQQPEAPDALPLLPQRRQRVRVGQRLPSLHTIESVCTAMLARHVARGFPARPHPHTRVARVRHPVNVWDLHSSEPPSREVAATTVKPFPPEALMRFRRWLCTQRPPEMRFMHACALFVRAWSLRPRLAQRQRQGNGGESASES